MTRVFSDDDLFAYLDGEQTKAEKEALESQLAVDPDLSERVVRLKGTWEMLSHLETVKTSDDFTKSTIALAAVAIDRPGLPALVKSNSKLLVGSLIALSVGFALVLVPSVLQSRRQLIDLPLINVLDLYRRADSVTFLRELSDAGLFVPDLRLEEALGGDSSEDISISSSGRVAARLTPFVDAAETKAAVAGMTNSQITELQRKRETFEALRDAEQVRIRRLHAELVADVDGQRLFSVLTRYQQWLKTLSSEQLVEIASLSSQERIARIRGLMSEQERSRFAELELNEDSQMPVEDVDAIMAWLDGYLTRHADEFLQQIPERFRRMIQGSRRRRIIPLLVSEGKIEAVPPSAEEFDELIKRLSKGMELKLASLEPRARMELVQSWLTSHGKSLRPPHPGVRFEQLDRFIREELSPEDRQKIDGMSAEKAKDELMQLYFQKHPPRGGFWRPPKREGNRRRWGDEMRPPPLRDPSDLDDRPPLPRH